MRFATNTRLPLKIFFGAGAILVVMMFVGLFFWSDYARFITFANIAKDHATLIDGIESYWSVEDLENHLRRKSVAWEIKRGSRPAPEDKRPPFIVDTVTIKNYSHLGFSGELVVEFFNNRLVGTKFWPQKIDRYVKRLASTEKLDIIGNQEVMVSKYTRIWVAVDHLGRSYVGWEDVRLNNEMEIWIKRYS
jgi:hypothetical protein